MSRQVTKRSQMSRKWHVANEGNMEPGRDLCRVSHLTRSTTSSTSGLYQEAQLLSQLVPAECLA